MITIITGNEPYRIDREKQKVLSGLYVPEMNLMRSDKFGKDEYVFLNTYPAMPDDRRILFIDCDKQSALDTAEFKEYLAEPDAKNDLFILVRNYDGRTTFGKFLKTNGLQTLNKLESEADIEKVILFELKQTGARITSDALKEFMKRENYLDSDDVNLLSIVSDLHAICAIDKDITLEMVKTYIAAHEVADRFALAKLIKAKDIPTLVKQAALLSKDDLIGVLSLLLREYRLAWKNNFAQLKGVKYVSFSGMSIKDSLAGMGICMDAIDRLKASTAAEESIMGEVFTKLCSL